MRKISKAFQFIRRYRFIAAALIVGGAMVGGSQAYAVAHRQQLAKSANGDTLNIDGILPKPIIEPASATSLFTAATLKQYDGKADNKCYIAVDGSVYSVADKKQRLAAGASAGGNAWAVCGTDMTGAAAKVAKLKKVGVYK
jgi:predicted heme/steroid binding protein